MKKKLHIFSGLGADERVFQLMDFSDFEVVHIHFIPPFKNESLAHYATRLLDQIEGNKPILVGLSFGGFVALEVARQIETEKVILIASAKGQYEIPFYLRLVGKLRLHKLIPVRLLKKSGFMANWFFGASSSFEKQILKQILADTNADFLRWAMNQALRWKNSVVHKNTFHIHGNRDRILPIRFVSCDFSVKNGGHLMTLTHAEELSAVIYQLLLSDLIES